MPRAPPSMANAVVWPPQFWLKSPVDPAAGPRQVLHPVPVLAVGRAAGEYANPTWRVLASVLHTRAGMEQVVPRGTMPPETGGTRCRTCASDVVEVLETWLSRPVHPAVRRSGRSGETAAVRLPGHTYLLNTLIGLVAVIAVVIALGLDASRRSRQSRTGSLNSIRPDWVHPYCWRRSRTVMSSALAMPSIRSAARGSTTGELTAVKHGFQAWVCDSGCLMNEMVGTADGGRGGR